MNRYTFILFATLLPLIAFSQTNSTSETKKGDLPNDYALIIKWGQEGKYDSIIHIGSQLIRVQPDNSVLLKLRGLAYLQLMNYNAAYSDFQTATTLSPDSADFWFLKAFAADKAGLKNVAKEAILKSLSLNDKKAQAWYLQGNLFSQEENLDEALACYNRAILLRRGYADALTMKGYVLYRKGDNSIAIETLKLAIEADNQYPLPYFYTGLCFVELDKPADALKSFDHAIRLGYDEGDLYHYRGLAMLQLRRFDDACDMWKEAVLRGYTLSKAMSKRYCRH